MKADAPPTAENKQPKLRWFRPTPARLLVILLAVEGILFLSKQWFPKGWAVLIAIASVGVTMLLMLIWWLAALCFHWRFQFSLRSLMVLTVAVAIPFSWLAVEMKRAREQREAVEWILKLGGVARYRFYVTAHPTPMWLTDGFGVTFFADVVEVTLDNTQVTDVELRHLKGLTQLEDLYLANTHVTIKGVGELQQLQGLSLAGTKVTDAGLEHLEGLTQLRKLCLDDTKITDAGLEYLTRLTQLDELSVVNTQVTDVGLVHLKGLPKLQFLHLGKTQVTDTGLQRLQGLKQLRWLFLDKTQTTDTGLEHLTGLTRLEWLDLNNTPVTDTGLRRLGKLVQLRFVILGGHMSPTPDWHISKD